MITPHNRALLDIFMTGKNTVLLSSNGLKMMPSKKNFKILSDELLNLRIEQVTFKLNRKARLEMTASQRNTIILELNFS